MHYIFGFVILFSVTIAMGTVLNNVIPNTRTFKTPIELVEKTSIPDFMFKMTTHRFLGVVAAVFYGIQVGNSMIGLWALFFDTSIRGALLGVAKVGVRLEKGGK